MSTDVSPIKIKENVKEALQNGNLRKAVKFATGGAIQTRRKTIGGIPDWEEIRQKNHQTKQKVIANLKQFKEQFAQNCSKNGFRVHNAPDAASARGLIYKIAQERGITRIVKSKSLTTEEIHLNPYLIEKGLDVLETDLGEYIIQLKDQMPSHLIVPALHLSKKDVGELFQEKLGCEYSEDPVELLQVARRTLREKFLEAEMGITGANFGIADPGMVCVVENEANAHLSLTLPKIHVIVMGIEKLIPRISDLPNFLKVLPPSATGQKASTYVNFIGSVGQNIHGEGPEEVHLILLDNGRSKIAQDPELKETVSCIRCGACLDACPVYRQIGGHAYGWAYMGPIGITLAPQYLGESEGRYAPFLCTLCKACKEVCPVKINLPLHLLTLRRRIVESGNSKTIEKLGISLWGFGARHPGIYRFTSWFPKKIQTLIGSKTPIPAPGHTKTRHLPPFDPKGFRARFRKKEHKK